MRKFMLLLLLFSGLAFIACESEEDDTEVQETEENDTMRQRILEEANETLDTAGNNTEIQDTLVK